MPRYRVVGSVTGSIYLGEFDAETPDEAKRMAEESDAAQPVFCHQCAALCEDPLVEAIEATEDE